MRFELVAESLGGETLFVEVSAKNKTNLDKRSNNKSNNKLDVWLET